MNNLKAVPWALAILILAQNTTADHQDKIFLIDGSVYAGKLENSHIVFDTAYGQFEIPNAACRSIEGKQKDLVKFNSLHQEIITGLLRQDLDVEQPDKVRVKISRMSIMKIVCTGRDKKQLPKASYLEMLDGDRFYGTILNENVQFTTSYSDLDTRFADIVKIELVRGQTQMLLANGDLLKGYISTPFIKVRSLYGFDMKVPNTSIKLIQLAAD
jgi:hypothetical protein